MQIRLPFMALALLALLPAVRAQAADCAALLKSRIHGAAVTTATPVAAGAFDIPAMGPMPAEKMMLPSFCRVKGTAAARIGFELWLPARHWNGRLLSVGSGGFGGFIDLRSLATYMRQGYAVTVNDTGHTGTGTAWMHDPKALLAWGHDATHLVAGPAKALVRAYYGKPQAYAYFQGCSTGGAQAMEEAEFFPRDFNGIVAESPGMGYSHLMLSFLWGLKSAQDNAVLSNAKLQLLHRAVMKTCDAKDGLKDGLLARPLACHIRPEDLVCKSGQTKNCLTPAEARTAALIYRGPRNPRTGAQIYPGFVPGSEADPSFTGKMAIAYGWTLIQGPLARLYAVPLLKNMVFGKDWIWRSFDWDHDVARVDAALGTKINSMDPDLRPFHKAGGKLVMVQGWGDPLNAQTLPIEYRREVIATFDRSMTRKASRHTVDGFYRLFMAPGMSHCLGGPGPSKVDALGALTRWVERGQAPAQLIAAKVNVPAGKVTTPPMRRPLCPYPEYARYVSGDPNKPASFRCVAPTVSKVSP